MNSAIESKTSPRATMAAQRHIAFAILTAALLFIGTLPIPSAQAAPWVTNSPLKVARFSHTATLLLNGQVLIAGGVDHDFDNTNSAELFDPATGTNRFTGSLITSRRDH